jgi:hypothetical protein
VQRIANVRSIICHVALACGYRGVDIARRLGITPSRWQAVGEKVISKYPIFFTLLNDSQQSPLAVD